MSETDVHAVAKKDLPRFIVGLPRSGSTWLSRSLNKHQGLFVFGETMYWGKRYISPNDLEEYHKDSLDKVVKNLVSIDFETTVGVKGTEGSKFVNLKDIPNIVNSTIQETDLPINPGDFFSLFCSAMARAERKTGWIEKTPHHIHYIDRIMHFLPKSRFVILLRDPYSFLLSYKHQKGHKNTEESRKRFADRYHPLGCAFVWRKTVEEAQESIQKYPTSCMLLDHSELLLEPNEVLQEILDFFQAERENIKGIDGSVFSSFDKEQKPKMSASDIFWMNLIAGPEIKRCGYSMRKKSWNIGNIIDIISSFVDIPFWIIRIIKDTRKVSGKSTFDYLASFIFRKKALN